jgi:hypothetical protein
MKTCIILFSHADTIKKENILKETILGLKHLNLPIILVSHAKISLEIQELVDYSLFEKNNFLIKETDLFNEELPITENNYNTQYFFGGVSTRCYVHKKTYGPAVINLYINGFNIAKYLGFDYAILWEYDYHVNEKTKENLTNFLSQVIELEYDGFFIPCTIAGIKSVTAVPAIFPINKFIDYINHDVIYTAKDYINVTNFEICEEWIYNFYKELNNPLTISYEEYFTIFSDLRCNLVSSGVDNPHFGTLNSGVFICKNDMENWIFSVFNGSKSEITIYAEIKYNERIIFNLNQTFQRKGWYYIHLPKDISKEILNSDSELNVFEKVTIDGSDEIYEYKINKNNIVSISKGKLFFYYE